MYGRKKVLLRYWISDFHMICANVLTLNTTMQISSAGEGGGLLGITLRSGGFRQQEGREVAQVPQKSLRNIPFTPASQ